VGGSSSNVLVTGGAGFIGSHLVRLLIGKGWRVVVLDDFSSGKMENLGEIVGSKGLRLIKGDIRNGKAVDDALMGVNSVVHLAAFVNPPESVKKPLETHDINVNGTLNLLEACVKRGVERFVFASSAAVYGGSTALPLVEECDLRPATPYATSKVAGEYYCKMYCACYGLSSVILRFFNVYGPGQGDNDYAGVITKFVHSGLRGGPLTVYGDGSQTRDFVNVKDVVEALEKALGFKSSKTDVFNVCTGKAKSINDLASSVCNILGKNLEVLHVQPRAGDILHNYGNPAKAQRLLGFKPQISFKDGLVLFVDSFD
jgi:nucleoside-diphosphate-sugar epimerase